MTVVLQRFADRINDFAGQYTILSGFSLHVICGLVYL